MPAYPLLMLLVFAFTLFTSATLLFLVQPMMGKMILPLLGGSPEVWNTCMVFFQAMLLAGYAYAHAAPAWLGVRRQAALHLGLLVLPLFFLPLSVKPHEALITGGSANPILQVLLLLLLTVGLPFFVISTSAPLLQKWFTDTSHPSARDPYFLYGASNFGSMIALLGYPFLVEPWLGVPAQAGWWVMGYVGLIALTGACAALLWLSPPAHKHVPGEERAPLLEGPAMAPSAAAIQKDDEALEKREAGRRKKRGDKNGSRTAIKTAPDAADKTAPDEPSTELGGAVTPWRRLRWVMLAFVPSSLMLGVTTYISTDISPIPLIWILPLTLYLLSFIVVFAKISPEMQSYGVWAILMGLLLGVAVGMPTVTRNSMLLAFVWAGSGLGAYFSLPLLKMRDPKLLHQALVLTLPLLVLVVVFMMLTGIKPGVFLNISLHLLLLFIVALVCHGEMARDRPATAHLTEFFLLMSVGGVLGGMFNALFAPLAFYSLAEYPLAMVVACMLLPPLTTPRDSRIAFYTDLVLIGVFLLIGGFLTFLALSDERQRLSFTPLPEAPWGWHLAVLLGAVFGGALYVARASALQRMPRLMDLALPAALALLTLGLYWGIYYSDPVYARVDQLAKALNISPKQLVVMMIFGLPAVLCYTFVERSTRFGLGVGAILLASGFNQLLDKDVLLRTRSFFGVLQVDRIDFDDRIEAPIFYGQVRFDLKANRLMHGTTDHGRQFLAPDLREEPLTYYHRNGPLGSLMAAYNRRDLPIGVIGLGTGTSACYGLKGQRMTFYDIDPTVVNISYNTDRYFSYITDAKKRGVEMGIVINDARLALDRNLKDHDGQLPADEKYGLLLVDAFSSDAIPVHLITWEAFEIYQKHLRPDGILAFHISNRHLDLKPVLARMVEKAGWVAYYDDDKDESSPGKSQSTWVVLAQSRDHLKKLRLEEDLKADQIIKALAARYRALGSEDKLKLLLDFEDVVQKWLDARAFPILMEFEKNPKQLEEQSSIQQQGLSDVEKKVFQEFKPDLDVVLAHTWWKVRTRKNVKLWTDDYSNLLSVFTW